MERKVNAYESDFIKFVKVKLGRDFDKIYDPNLEAEKLIGLWYEYSTLIEGVPRNMNLWKKFNINLDNLIVEPLPKELLTGSQAGYKVTIRKSEQINRSLIFLLPGTGFIDSEPSFGAVEKYVPVVGKFKDIEGQEHIPGETDYSYAWSFDYNLGIIPNVKLHGITKTDNFRVVLVDSWNSNSMIRNNIKARIKMLQVHK